MDNPSLVKNCMSPFFGEHIYDEVVPQGNFLRQLNQIFDWDWFNRRLLILYIGGGGLGRPAVDPAMDLIAFLSNLTDRKVEVYVNEKLTA
jgi:hypothetical protein